MANTSKLEDKTNKSDKGPGRQVLKIRDLHTQFSTPDGVVKAVDGVSFDVIEGKTVGIVGESGCGKSVLARSVLQLIQHPGRIVGGEVLYHQYAEGEETAGQNDILGLPPGGSEIRSIRGGHISMIFQEPMSSFSPVHTIGNQMVEALRLHKPISKVEANEQAVDWLQRVGMPNPSERIRAYPHELSGGQLQRAMIALALSTNPSVLIADEPTTGLDVTTQAQILELLGSLQAEHGMAMIFITHDLGVIAEIADDVLVMYLGRVVEEASVTQLFQSPQHPYTKALFTSMPGTGEIKDNRLPTIKGSVPEPHSRPMGCFFHPRCDSFMPGTCDRAEPELLAVNGQQKASCFLYTEGEN